MDDDALQRAISAAEELEVTCDFCGRTPAAELDVLLRGHSGTTHAAAGGVRSWGCALGFSSSLFVMMVATGSPKRRCSRRGRSIPSHLDMG